MTLATLARDGGEDLVLFLHGLGCAKECFAGLWDTAGLAGATLLAPDLPGHGASQGLPAAAWSMEGMTAAVGDLLRDHAAETARLHVVVHSMGGAVGLLLAEETPIPLASFITVEGNLVDADCGMLSRRTAEMDLKEFRDEKFARLKARARDADDPIVRAWAGWMEACPAEALHASARSLVAWSDSGRLLEIFQGLPVPTAYVYGEQSANPDVLAHLESIAKYRIAECGHFVMIDKPAELSSVIGAVMAETRP
jgi:pimeloyl-ACP methyl ester carboxylesterase